MENPFKFGTIVEEEYFTDRVKEVAFICQFLNSANHLILIFGKSCVVIKAVKQTGELRTSTIYSASDNEWNVKTEKTIKTYFCRNEPK